MRVVTLASGVTVVDDSYNANPASVAAALEARGAATRRIAVLGDMLELGPASAAQHRAVGTSRARSVSPHSTCMATSRARPPPDAAAGMRAGSGRSM